MNDAEKLKDVVESGLAEAGYAGSADISEDMHEDVDDSNRSYCVRFARNDGIRTGICGGGRPSEKRTIEDIGRVFVQKLTEWFTAYDKDPSTFAR